MEPALADIELPVQQNLDAVLPVAEERDHVVLAGPAYTPGDLILVSLSEVKEEAIEWFWEGRIPIGHVTVISGDPGLGKSQLTAMLAAAATAGVELPGGSDLPVGSAILLNCEDGVTDTIKPRIAAAGADIRRVHVITGTAATGSAHRQVDLHQDIERLGQALEQLGDVRLVVIDPISAYGGPKGMNEGTSVRALMGRLQQLAAKHRVAVVLVTHLNKRGGRNAISAVKGSGELIAAARSALLVAQDPDDEDRRLLLPQKTNLARTPGLAFEIVGKTVGEGIRTSCVEFLDTPVLHTADTVGKSQPTDRLSKVDQACDFLREALADGARPTSEVEEEARQLGISGRNLERARAALGIRSEKAAMKGPWLISLPNSVKNAEDRHGDVGGLRESWRPSDGSQAGE
ncbi:AAA family ATPase [Alsobacter soli]|uniref:AAA family ATPase n=1 Tax=Alsobacter soli TaxID=2109933 RepID=UPI001304D183|nr:AAA family ATPase [Alsobacter soli]